MRGGIAERGGIRVGHRIIEINGQSVVATPHDKIIQILTNAVGEVRNAEMCTSTERVKAERFEFYDKFEYFFFNVLSF